MEQKKYPMLAPKGGSLPLDAIETPPYPTPVSEQETVIRMSRDEGIAYVYTNDLTRLTKLKKAAGAEGSQLRLVEIQAMGKPPLQCGWGFEGPARSVTVRSGNRIGKAVGHGFGKTEEEDEDE